MTTITVQLPEGLDHFLATQAVAEGHASAGDYVVALLRQAQQARQRASLEARLQEGVEALDRGEGRPMQAGDWERLRQGVRNRYGVGGES